MTTLEKAIAFSEKNEKKIKVSVLEPHFEGILWLYDKGYTYKKILEFLRVECNIEVASTTLMKYVQRKRKSLKKRNSADLSDSALIAPKQTAAKPAPAPKTAPVAKTQSTPAPAKVEPKKTLQEIMNTTYNLSDYE